jgi:hypothetical protein
MRTMVMRKKVMRVTFRLIWSPMIDVNCRLIERCLTGTSDTARIWMSSNFTYRYGFLTCEPRINKIINQSLVVKLDLCWNNGERTISENDELILDYNYYGNDEEGGCER